MFDSTIRNTTVSEKLPREHGECTEAANTLTGWNSQNLEF
jgi:hypothetical protein